MANVLLDFGDRVQESVFECDLKTDAKRREIVRRVRKYLDAQADTVRVYRVCASCRLESQIVGADHAPPSVPQVLIL